MTWQACLVKKVFAIVQAISIGRKQNAVILDPNFRLYYISWLNLITFNYLVPKNGINQKCEKNNECDESKNLLCKDGICQCKDASLYWNEKSISCCMV